MKKLKRNVAKVLVLAIVIMSVVCLPVIKVGATAPDKLEIVRMSWNISTDNGLNIGPSNTLDRIHMEIKGGIVRTDMNEWNFSKIKLYAGDSPNNSTYLGDGNNGWYETPTHTGEKADMKTAFKYATGLYGWNYSTDNNTGITKSNIWFKQYEGGAARLNRLIEKYNSISANNDKLFVVFEEGAFTSTSGVKNRAQICTFQNREHRNYGLGEWRYNSTADPNGSSAGKTIETKWAAEIRYVEPDVIYYSILSTQSGAFVTRLNKDVATANMYVSFFDSKTFQTVRTPYYTWSSSDNSIVSIDTTGVVTRKKAGEAYIRISPTNVDPNVVYRELEGGTICVQQEKTIVVGASTVAQLGNERKVDKFGNKANINYWGKWGFSVSKNSGAVHSNIPRDYVIDYANLIDRHNVADLFFVCEPGKGLAWLNSVGIDKIREILTHNEVPQDENSVASGGYPHFTIIIKMGGNNLGTNAPTRDSVENVAIDYINACYSIANINRNMNVIMASETPTNIGGGFGTGTGKTNEKRSYFAVKVEEYYNGTPVASRKNLHYINVFANFNTTAFRNDLWDGGHHYNGIQAFNVLKYMLEQSWVIHPLTGKKW